MVPRVFYFTDGIAFGGAEQALVNLVAGLDRARWQPCIIHHREPGLAPLYEQATNLGVPLHERPRTQADPTSARWVQLASLTRYLRSERPTVFHASLTWPLACKYGLLAAMLAQVPAIVATGHYYFEVGRPTGLYLQRAIALGVDRFLGVSGTIADGFRRTLHLPARKVTVVYNGIPVAPFERPPASDLRAWLTGGTERPVVLTVARLDRQKGHQFLLRAATELPEPVFAFAGDGPERAALEAQARSLGIHDRTRFLGHRTDIPELLASSDLFVLPSLNEGLPLSVLEAMAANKPVVATAVGGTGEAITHGHNGLLVPPADPAALASAMRSVLFNPDLADRLASAGYARVRQDFTSDVMVERTVHVYEEILDQHAGQRRHGVR